MTVMRKSRREWRAVVEDVLAIPSGAVDRFLKNIALFPERERFLFALRNF